MSICKIKRRKSVRLIMPERPDGREADRRVKAHGGVRGQAGQAIHPSLPGGGRRGCGGQAPGSHLRPRHQGAQRSWEPGVEADRPDTRWFPSPAKSPQVGAGEAGARPFMRRTAFLAPVGLGWAASRFQRAAVAVGDAAPGQEADLVEASIPTEENRVFSGSGRVLACPHRPPTGRWGLFSAKSPACGFSHAAAAPAPRR